MTDANAVTQDDLVNSPDAPQTPPQLTQEQHVQMARNSMMRAGVNQWQALRNFIKQLPLEPPKMNDILGKLDDAWVWVRVVIEDMQINPPPAA